MYTLPHKCHFVIQFHMNALHKSMQKSQEATYMLKCTYFHLCTYYIKLNSKKFSFNLMKHF